MSLARQSPRAGLELLPDDEQVVAPARVWSMRIVAAAGLVLSGVLAWAAFNGTHVAGCGGERSWFDCESVLGSRWSTWLGLPVSFPAVSVYASLLSALAFGGPLSPPAIRRLAWMLVLVLTAVSGLAGAWFTALQFFSLQHWCAYCLGVHVCSLLLLGLAWYSPPVARARLPLLGSGALVLAAGLVGGQLLVAPPPAFEVTHSDPSDAQQIVALKPVEAAPKLPPEGEKKSPAEEAQPVKTTPAEIPPPPPPVKSDVPPLPPRDPPAAPESHKPKSRIISVAVRQTKVELDVYEHPHLGNPEAPHVVVKLFDYTCHHCRALHAHLVAARARYGEQFVVVLLPTPLNKSCNPILKTDFEAHKNGCELARYALAVYRARPERFAEYDTFLFEPATPPSLARARGRAQEIVGEREFDRELNGKWVEDELKSGVRLYGLCYPLSSQIPKLLFGQIMTHGEMTQDELFSRLEHEWKLTPK